MNETDYQIGDLVRFVARHGEIEWPPGAYLGRVGIVRCVWSRAHYRVDFGNTQTLMHSDELTLVKRAKP